MLDYRALVKMRLSEAKTYPYRARRLRREGTVTLQFLIDAHGRTGQVKLVTSSGTQLLDNAAIQLVKAIPDLPTPPVSPFDMTVSFRYELE